jgi:tryptophanase
MQRYTVYLYLESALHVSGGTSTHGHMAGRNMQRIEINIHEKGIVRQVGYLQRL